MGPFFYSKKDIPAKSDWFKRVSFLLFLIEIPPNATTFFFVSFLRFLNLLIPKKFLFFLKRDDKKICPTFWISLVRISLRLWADPIILNFFLYE